MATRRWSRALHLLVVCMLVLAACGDDGDADASDEDSGSEDGDVTEEVTLDTDATLTLAWPVPPVSFDPHLGSFFTGYPMQSPVIEQLVHNPAPGVLEPELAESWSYSADGLSFTIELREGIEFHDGEPFDAEAAKANLERARDLAESTAARRLSAVETVEVVDESTVQLGLATPDAALPAALATNAGSMISPASFDDPELDFNPVGTGPYELSFVEPGDRAEYTRIGDYGDHWDPEAGKVAELVIIGIQDPNARVSAIESGEVDAGYILTDGLPDAGQIAESSEELVLWPYRSENRTAMLFNRTVAPTDDMRVRQAVNLAIDRQAIVDELLGGIVQPAWQLFIEGNLGHVAELDGFAEHDPDRARELLADAGFEDGLTISPVFVSEQASAQAQVVQDMLSDVGITLDLEVVDSDVFLENWAEQQAPAAFGFLAPELDPANFMDRLLSDEFDFAGVTDEWRQLAEEGRDSTSSQEDRDAAYQEINRIHTEEAWNVLVAQLDIAFLADEAVTGLETMPYSVLSIWDPRYLGVAE